MTNQPNDDSTIVQNSQGSPYAKSETVSDSESRDNLERDCSDDSEFLP